MLQMKARCILIRPRDSQNFSFLKESAEESERNRRAVIAEAVREDHSGMSREIGGQELRKIRGAGRRHDYIDRSHQIVPVLNCNRSQPIRVYIVDSGNEARGSERIWPIAFPLLDQLLVPIRSRQ